MPGGNINKIIQKAILLLICTFPLICSSQQKEWIIQFEDGFQYTHESFLINKSRIEIELLSSELNIWLLSSQQDISSEEISSSFKDQKIVTVFPNLNIETRNADPNDFFYPEQWNLGAINISQAWDQSTGGQDANGKELVIAVLDDGYDVFHEDLKDNYWKNPQEIPGDNIDNDNNGYIDDHMGVNIQTGDGNHAGVKHGTQVAGILGASTDNNFGIAGVNWNTKVLLISGVSNIGEVIKAMEYIFFLKQEYLNSQGQRGANIIVSNFSGGLRRLFPEDFPSWCDMYELLGAVGVLSVGATANENFDVETEGDMPTLCSSDHLIMVTNSNSSNEKVLDAAYGSVSVDLAAPGENIISTSIGNDYETISGTSASAPHVAGVVALLHSLPCSELADLSFSNPSEASLIVKQAILNGTNPAITLGTTVSGGILDAYQAMVNLQDLCGTQRSNNLSLKVYPNFIDRTVQQIKIAYESPVNTDHRITLYDLQGKAIYEREFVPPLFQTPELTLDLTSLDLAPGIYVLQLANSEEKISKRIVKI